MKSSVLISVLIAGVFLFLSCQSEFVESTDEISFFADNESVLEYDDVLQFTYGGVAYSSRCYEMGDSLVIEDAKVAALYDSLMNLSGLAIYCDSDGSVVYFDSFEDLRKMYEGNLESHISPAYVFDEKLYLYKDAGYLGKCVEFSLNGSLPLYVTSLSDYDFNDELTSFKVEKNGVNSITLFRNAEYEAQSITFKFTDELSVTSLKNYRLKKKMTWNDRVSSLQVYPGEPKFEPVVSES